MFDKSRAPVRRASIRRASIRRAPERRAPIRWVGIACIAIFALFAIVYAADGEWGKVLGEKERSEEKENLRYRPAAVVPVLGIRG